MNDVSADLRFYLLGNVSIEYQGKTLHSLPSKAAEALLIFVLHHKRPLARERLAELFWPERDAKQAAANLRSVLSSLRKALPDYLDVTRQTVAFNHERLVWLDSAEFESQSSATQQNIAAAIALYRGDFLDAFYLRDASEFETWAIVRREQLRMRAIQLLAKQIELTQRSGDLLTATNSARKLLAIDPFQEKTHRQLMLLLMRDGQRIAALRQYKTCEQLLADELAIEPARKTQQLYQYLQRLDFPPPVVLPQVATPFVGREGELDALSTLLHSAETQLITILGAGGMGKSRLAIEVARQFSKQRPGRFLNGIYFISLAPVATGEQLVPTIANALGVRLGGNEAPAALLASALREQEMLLVLDNFEHLIDHKQLIDRLVGAAPQCKLLLTSRERLQLTAEHTFALAGLPTGGTVAQSAITLFEKSVERNGAKIDDYSAANAICRLVDGLPLAIELAAAWVKIYGCAAIAEKLEANIDLLATRTSNLPPRQRSIRATFDYSWDLLTPLEQQTLSQLAVFPSNFALATSEHLLASDPKMIASLVDKALLRVDNQQQFSLHPLLRQYAAERLETDREAAADLRTRHANYFMGLVASRLPALNAAYTAGRIPKQILSDIVVVIDDVRAAWSRQVAFSLPQQLIGEFVESFGRFLAFQSWYQEAVELYTTALTSDHVSHLQRGRWLRLLAGAYHGVGDTTAAEAQFKLALSQFGHSVPTGGNQFKFSLAKNLSQQLGYHLTESWRQKGVKSAEMLEASRAFDSLSRVYFYSAQPRLFGYCSLRALNLAERIGDKPALARGYANMTVGLGMTRRHKLAASYVEKALSYAEDCADEPARAYAHTVSAVYGGMVGDWQRSQQSLETAIAIHNRVGDTRQWGECMVVLATNNYAQGRYAQAIEKWQPVLEAAQASGNKLHLAWSQTGLAGTLISLGRPQEALYLLEPAYGILLERDIKQSMLSNRAFWGWAQQRLGNWRAALDSAELVLRINEEVSPTFTTIVAGYSSVCEVYLATLELTQAEIATLGLSRARLLAQADQSTAALLDYSKAISAAGARAAYYRGLYLWHSGERDEAMQQWRQALPRAKQLGMAYDEARAQFELGRHLPSGLPERQSLLEDAEHEFLRLKTPIEAARAALYRQLTTV